MMGYRVALLAVACCFLTRLSAAQAPPYLTYDGELFLDGVPYDGSATVQLDIIAKDVSNNDVVRWSETLAGVTITAGRFSVTLGQTQPLSAALFDGAPLWLQVSVNGQVLSPRAPIHSVPYAFRAEESGTLGGGYTAGDFVLPADLQSGGSVTVDWSRIANVPAMVSPADLSTPGGVTVNAANVGNLPLLTCNAGDALAWDGSQLGCFDVAAWVGPHTTSLDWSAITNRPTGLDDGDDDTDTHAGTLCQPGEYLDGDGSCYDLATAVPPPSLASVSNGLLTNEFSSIIASPNTPVSIPDNNPVGVEDSFLVPDLGTAQSLSVSVDISNSNVASGLRVLLYDPDNVEHLLYDDGGAASPLVATYPDPDVPVSGNLNGWVGRNPQGQWRLKIIDDAFLNNGVDGQINGWSVATSYISNSTVEVAGNLTIGGRISGDGSVPPGAVMFFELPACPVGWTELVSARGRYLVGVQNTGVLSAAVGTALADQESRAVGQHNHTAAAASGGAHTHTITDPGHVHGGVVKFGSGQVDWPGSTITGGNTNSATTGITINNAGDHIHTVTVDAAGAVSDTNAPYLQLRVCKKN